MTPERIPLQNVTHLSCHQSSNGTSGPYLRPPATPHQQHKNGKSSPITSAAVSDPPQGGKGSPRTVFVTIHENEVTTKLLQSDSTATCIHSPNINGHHDKISVATTATSTD